MSRTWAHGSTRQWRRVRALVLARDGHTCRIRLPGCIGHATHVDHIVLKSKGGTDDPANLRAACRPCNLRRGNTPDPDPAPTPRTRW